MSDRNLPAHHQANHSKGHDAHHGEDDGRHDDHAKRQGGEHHGQAGVRPTRFSIIWLLPILAVLIAGYLIFRSLSDRGPDITLTFDTAEGLTAGQTQVKNKAVSLGTVQKIELSEDMHRVVVHIRMKSSTEHILTEKTRFWVVRPRINGASVTGLETLLSGAYIAIDPGPPGGHPQKNFVGLESAPGVRSDQPGSTFVLFTPTLGSIGEGAPVFFRDKVVGEILGYTMPPGGEGPILLQAFIRSPYDHYLHRDSRFWNVSGVQVGLGAGGLKVQLTSFQALLSGGVAFGLPPGAHDAKGDFAPPNSVFKLYRSEQDAKNANSYHKLKVITYLDNSVKGLSKGADVTMFGINVGTVLDVALKVDPETAKAQVRVTLQLELERLLPGDRHAETNKNEVLSALIAHGMRASMTTVSFLTGESAIALTFVKKGKPETIDYEDDLPIVPSISGGFDGIMASASTIMDKIAAMPLTQLGDHANDLVTHADQRINSAEVKQSLVSLRDSLQHLSSLSRQMDRGVKPLMKRLPEMSRQLDLTLKNARQLMATYGGDADFKRDLQSMIIQLTQSARSIRFLTTYLNNHPSALITGRH